MQEGDSEETPVAIGCPSNEDLDQIEASVRMQPDIVANARTIALYEHELLLRYGGGRTTKAIRRR